jgi:hypothetical protein
MPDLISVWDKNGVEHQMSRANATDMVNHNKWTTENPNIQIENGGDIAKKMPEQFERGFFAQKPKIVGVIDKDGNVQSMDLASAQDMVRHLGWRLAQNQVAPTPEPVVEEDFEPSIPTQANLATDIVVKKRGRPAKNAETVEPPLDEEAELTAMDRDQLVAYAKKVLDLTFEDSATHDEILDTILREM